VPRAGLEPALCALNRTNRRHSVHISWFRLSGAGRFGGLWATPLALRPKVLKSVLGRRLVRRGRDPDGAHRALLAVENARSDSSWELTCKAADAGALAGLAASLLVIGHPSPCKTEQITGPA
jgi:hypothetical protein